MKDTKNVMFLFIYLKFYKINLIITIIIFTLIIIILNFEY